MRRELLVVLGVACTKELPPPARPELVVPHPTVALGPPAAGEGVVWIDTVGGQADVFDKGELSTRLVCTTPCEVHLPQGVHSLAFRTTQSDAERGDGRITVGAVPTVYRYALGHDVDHSTTIAIAGTGMLVGSIVVLFGVDGRDSATTALGVGLVALGALGLAVFRPEHQPGVGVQWTPQRSAPDAP